MNYELRTHATVTVRREEDGSIRHVVARAEVYEEDPDKPDTDDEKFRNGVAAKFKFGVHNATATLSAVKDIEDKGGGSYETDMGFVRAIPVAEQAVWNVPGIDDVDSTEGYLTRMLDKGRSAISQPE
jgi:hypothetical protein